MSSVLWIRIQWSSWIRIRIRIQEGKSGPEKYKRVIRFIVWNAKCSLLRAEGFSCSLDVLYGGLGISKFKFLIKKRWRKKFWAVPMFLSMFVHQNCGSVSGFGLAWNSGSVSWYSVNPDPQHCMTVFVNSTSGQGGGGLVPPLLLTGCRCSPTVAGSPGQGPGHAQQAAAAGQPPQVRDRLIIDLVSLVWRRHFVTVLFSL
jgi:hypothetical protein